MLKRPRSIWDYNRKYNLIGDLLINADAKLLARLQSIEAAKKRTPPVPLAHLIRLCDLLANRPRVDRVDAEAFAAYLSRLIGYGVRIPIAVCMLSVLSNGAYPPIDAKVTIGLLRRKLITERQASALKGNKPKVFAPVYVCAVLPEWRRLRKQGMSPRVIDEKWSAY